MTSNDIKLLMGNEAMGLGALRAGIHLACGYPGTPSSEILETVARENVEGVYCEWSVNEKAALETAAGAALAGAWTLVTMKQMGVNVASDPLMCINYVGFKGAMVVVAADDPGPISSQTEQDTRHFAEFAHIPLFDPSTPEEAYTMMVDAFALSHKLGRPVIVRPTTRVCHSYASVEILPPLPRPEIAGWTADNGRWVIFPRLSYQRHLEIVKEEKELTSHKDTKAQSCGYGKRGIITGGVSWCYVKEALSTSQHDVPILKIDQYPVNENLVLDFLQGKKEVLVVEELDPVIENNLFRICGKHHVTVTIHGKHDGSVSVAGELSVALVEKTIADFLNINLGAFVSLCEVPPLPARPPVLCQGCPHRDSFMAVKEAVGERQAVYSGDIGCYTLGNMLGATDTCLCMGAGITQAAGMHRVQPDLLNIAFIGDSTFFASGITGLVNAVYNGADEIVCVLDNSTTAMTGGQPHPGMGRTLMGDAAPKISIYDVVKALGVSNVERVNCRDKAASVEAVKKMIAQNGVRVIIFEGKCVTYR
jgi:indolepyruvate ferredoxin oxidoreductase alpha subunit